MAREHGFKFEIKAVVFIAQKSRAGADVVAAYDEAMKLRAKLQGAIADWPIDGSISDPVTATRPHPKLRHDQMN